MGDQIKLLTVVGARPQFVKAAVISRAISTGLWAGRIQEVLIHTGQHYDTNMSDVFFSELRIPQPKKNLDVGSGTPHIQLSKMLERLGSTLRAEQPDIVLVYGDTNSTLAAAIAASHQNIPLVHVEGGERIYRRYDVPEELNRVLTDHSASLVLTSTRRAEEYLLREGFGRRARFVGDPMYDLFVWGQNRYQDFSKITPGSLNLKNGQFHLATVHRAENTNNKQTLIQLFDALSATDLPVVLPVHPRVQQLIRKWGYQPKGSLRLIEALGYFDFMSLLMQCKRVFTDSGGVTREAFFAEKPCIIPMSNSWWTEIVEAGWAKEVGTNSGDIVTSLNEFTPKNELPTGLFGDGNSANKIIEEIIATISPNSLKRNVAWHRHGSYRNLPKATQTDFTLKNYRKILDELQNLDYVFKTFPESERLLKKDHKFVLLRHDIDLSLEDALAMAELEADANVKATYFFMVRNDFYNIFSKSGSDIVRKILKLGHDIALHFDCAAYPDEFDKSRLAQACNEEAEMLRKWFHTPIQIVSYHRPNQLVLTSDASISAPLKHTYLPEFTKEIHYCSDSGGTWNHGHPLELTAIKQGKPLHLLVHPIWWKENPISPYQTLLKLVDRHQKVFENNLAANCKVYQVGDLKEVYESCNIQQN